jgi:signal transduction histidine kinase
VLLEANINEIVKDVLSIAEIPENVNLVVELKAPYKLKVDKDMMKRAFMNLTLNGVQAMSGKAGKLTVSTKKVKGFLEIRFKDTGVGIPKDNLDKIFTPLFTTKAKGMGMGLSICKKFVELHGGIIKVESDEGKGSTFTVRLPIQQG